MNFLKPFLFQIKGFIIALMTITLILFPTTIIMIPFNLKTRLKLYAPSWSLFGKIILKWVCHCKIQVSEDLRSQEFKKVPTQGLYIANHQSFIDIPLILTAHQAPPIMKKEISYIPLFGQVALLAGALPVARSRKESRKKVFERAKKRILTEKLGLQFYPEGTRSKTPSPKTFEEIKKTLLYFAYDENIPVIPTSLYGTRGVLDQYGMIHPGKKLGIIVHKELYPRDFLTSEEFVKECWDQVLRGFEELRTVISDSQ